MKKISLLTIIALSSIFILSGCGSHEDTTVNNLVPVPEVINQVPVPEVNVTNDVPVPRVDIVNVIDIDIIQPTIPENQLPACNTLEQLNASINVSQYAVDFLGGDVELETIVYGQKYEISIIGYHYVEGMNIKQKITDVSDRRGSNFVDIRVGFNVAPNLNDFDLTHEFDLKQYCMTEDGNISAKSILAGGFIQLAYDDELDQRLDDIENQLTTLVTITSDTNGNVQTIIGSNIKPVAFAGDDKFARLNTKVLLDGNGQDPDGTIVAYQWTVGKKIVSNSKVFNYKTTKLGRIILTLKVTDNDGATSTDSMILTVTKK